MMLAKGVDQTYHTQATGYTQEPLAIVGVGCRLPGGVTDKDSYWALLVERRHGIKEVPADRWDWRRFYHNDTKIAGKIVSRWGAFVDNYDQFDADLFGITPREAQYMDPQQRWLLETSWRALEDAGIPVDRLAGEAVGVFVGISTTEMGDRMHGDYGLIDIHSGTGGAISIASNRLSFTFDFKGPSVSVDTACSSALVATALACQSILSGESKMALAGGVNALLSPKIAMTFSRASMLSPDGRCFTFDSRANGYVRGEGAGMIVIKRLADAINDGDHVYAVIRSTSVNQDGRSSSLTVPSMESQEAMLRAAYARAGIDPAKVSYVEAHGTGTPVGDPIEAHALGHVLGENRPADDPCLIGSVKTNIGHLEPASGIASLIKASLIFEHGVIPPQLNFEERNPLIPLDELGLQVVTEQRELPRYDDQLPTIGVNSFGFGGTNAHIVLEAPPAIPESAEVQRHAERPVVLPLSALDHDALVTVADDFHAYLQNNPEPIARIAASAGERRTSLPYRLTVSGGSAADLRAGLRAFLNETAGPPHTIVGQAGEALREPTFVYTGQGAQWTGMGQQLMLREPIFREVIEEIDRIFESLSGWPLLAEMARDEAESRINDTDVTQPAMFAVQVGLTRLWESWGIRPGRVIGHSVGEVAAAWAAGIYSLEDAGRIIYHRSRLQHTTAGQGTMVAVALSLGEMLHRLNGHKVQIAAINSPSLLTLAGDPTSIADFAADLAAQDVFVRELPIQYAFHTSSMDGIKEELLASLANIQPKENAIPFISTVSGEVTEWSILDAGYWWQNVRQPVSFASALTGMIRNGETTFLEIGPHPALASSIQECLAEQNVSGQVFHSLRRESDESEELLINAGRMYTAGFRVDWEAINQAASHPMRFPRYPMHTQPYGMMTESFRQSSLLPLVHPLLGLRIESTEPTWEGVVDPRVLTYLADHQIWESIVFPGAGYVEAALAAAEQLFPGEPYAVEELVIKRAMFVSDQRPPTMRKIYHPEDHSFSIYSLSETDSDWQLHAVGYLRRLTPVSPDPIDVIGLRDSLPERLARDEFYSNLLRRGYGFGPEFQHVQNVWLDDDQVLGEVQASETIAGQIGDYQFHPALLDACIQIFSAAGFEDEVIEELPYLPAGFGRVRMMADRIPDHFWVRAVVVEQTDYVLNIDLQVYDDDGYQIADIRNARFDHITQSSLYKEELNQVYQFHWEPRRLRSAPLPAPADFPSGDEVMRAARAALPDVYQKHQMEDYYAIAPTVAYTATLQAIQNAFLELGWDYASGEMIHFDGLVDRMGIIARHFGLFRYHLNALVEANYLRLESSTAWEVLKPLTDGSVDAILEAGITAFPRFETEANLIRAAAAPLSGIYRGVIDPLSVLFPDSSMSLLHAFYESGGEQAPHYDLIASAVRRACQSLPEDRPLRILEVGAGTGGLTDTLLAQVPVDQIEYTFTDIGPSFLQTARQRFADIPGIAYQGLDLNKDLERQGFTPGSFDVVLAANVLHAVPEIDTALGLIRSLLTPQGLLIFLELTRTHHTYTSIFGLLPEWWYQREEKITLAIQGHEKWLADLVAAGFRQVDGLRSSIHADEGWCSTFVAQAPEQADSESEPEPSPNVSLIFADQSGVAEGLARALELAGERVLIVQAGTHFEQIVDANTFTLNPSDEDDLRQLHAILDNAALTVNRIVVAWGLDHPSIYDLSGLELVTAQEKCVLFAFRLARVMSKRDASKSPQVVFLSRNTQPVRANDDCSGLEAAMTTGFVRVVNNEYPTYHWMLIDLDADSSADPIDDLVWELLLPDEELEVAYRGGQRYVNRLHRVPLETLPRIKNAITAENPRPYRLEMTRPGRITNLSLNLSERRFLGPHEVEIEVKAAGLNFRDLMKVLGLYPGKTDDLRWLGDDIAGVVTATGEAVTSLKPGDEVFGFAPYGFRSHIALDPRLVIWKPPQITFEEAATIPTVFATAHYALVDLARMREGERVLIHAGTGGVGQAAIQVAQHLGLEIFATAGTDEKRAFLREQGIQHVFNSRTLDFADEIMAVTDGRGVDAVLNSLAGDFIPKNLSVLAPFGRYLEIGKIDVYKNSKLGLEALRNNISLHIIDLGQMLLLNDARVMPLMQTIEDLFAQSIYRPLATTVFPISEAQEAFRYMASAQHIGKIVLTFDQPEIEVNAASGGENRFRSDGTYLIIGGTRGLGLEIAGWLANQGVRHFTLMSRGGVIDEDSAGKIEKLREEGVMVSVAQGDVTDPAGVERIIGEIQAGAAPLIGVIHSAMILRDGLIAEGMEESRWSEALWVKAAGAWNLHRATLDIPLEHFICISSSTSIYGGSTQSNYSAGNAFLDGLAHYRRMRGLPALTINLGAFSGAGHLDRDKANAEFLDALGLKLMSLQDTLTALGELLQTDSPQSGVFIIDWNSLGRALPMVVSSKVYSYIVRDDMSAGADDSMLEQILAAPARERPALIERFLVKSLAFVMDTAIDRIDPAAPLSSLGLDSLMSVELVNLMNNQLAAVNMTMAVSEVLSANTILDIANVLVRKFSGDENAAETASDLKSAMADMLLNMGGDGQARVDFEAEAVLDPAVIPSSESLPPAEEVHHVLLTGASGFLGAFLLRDLLRETDYHITCLVRAEDDPAAFARIRTNLDRYSLWDDSFEARITAMPGDLALPGMGLSEEQYDGLAESVDAIIHNASNVSLVQPYHALKQINVQGVEEVLRLATRSRIKPVHYVSTMSVFYATLDNNPLIDESQWGDPASLPNGYRQSKWVAEQLIRQAMERGIPCTLYRPGIISGDSQSGATNLDDMPSRILIGTHQLGAVSDRESIWNMVPVDFVSKAIVYLFGRTESRGEVFHLTHPQNTHLSEIVDLMGLNHVPRLTYGDWRTAIIQQAKHRIDNALIPLLPLFPEEATPEVVLNLDSRKTLTLLEEAGIICPPVDVNLLAAYRGYLIASGALQHEKVET